MQSSRTANSLVNIKYAIIGQFFGLCISFVTRFVFVRTLNVDYLGVDGLFVNVLSILSLVDLGLGTAVIYSLYKPLAENDERSICLLLKLYRNYFRFIGIAVLLLGLFVTPFINSLVKEIPNIPYIKLIFLLFVIDTSIGYFFAHKRSLIIADQKRYITSLYRYSFFFTLNIIQILLLLIFKNYLLYLIAKIVFTFLENILISYKANKLYPFIKNKINGIIDKDEKKSILRNVKSMAFHKVGGVVVKSTDNILISKLVGVEIVGLYSNYILIINALNIIYSIIFQNVTASIGNLALSASHKLKYNFNILNLIGYYIYAISAITLLVLFNPFISLWLGNNYLLSKDVIFVIVFNFYIDGMRKSVLTYRDALGLYWYDRYKPFVEAIINLIFSLVLGIKYGILGILLGTSISTLFICTVVEPYILFKYGFKASVVEYFSSYFKFFALLIFSGFIVYFTTTFVGFDNVFRIIVNLLVSTFTPFLIITFFYKSSSEFNFLLSVIKNYLVGNR